eukprot:366517-Chlamydomonas_euryale.AAC.22
MAASCAPSALSARESTDRANAEARRPGSPDTAGVLGHERPYAATVVLIAACPGWHPALAVLGRELFPCTQGRPIAVGHGQAAVARFSKLQHPT